MLNIETSKSTWSGRMRRFSAIVALAFFMLPTLSIIAVQTPLMGLVGIKGVVLAQDPPAEEEEPVQQTPNLPPQDLNDQCDGGDCSTLIITKYVDPAITTVSAIVGIAVTISIITGGIQYATSADNPQKVSAAKQRIVTAIFVLLGYFLLFSFLNYIVPGGII